MTPLKSSFIATTNRTGYSLLEMILALAILAGALATIGEVMRTSRRNAMTAQDLTTARILCESRMAEIESGALPLEPVSMASYDDALAMASSASSLVLSDTSATMDATNFDPTESESVSSNWFYSVEVTPIDDEGLTEVRVTVELEVYDLRDPVQFSLVRWMIDEEALVAAATTVDDGSTEGASDASMF